MLFEIQLSLSITLFLPLLLDWLTGTWKWTYPTPPNCSNPAPLQFSLLQLPPPTEFWVIADSAPHPNYQIHSINITGFILSSLLLFLLLLHSVVQRPFVSEPAYQKWFLTALPPLGFLHSTLASTHLTKWLTPFKDIKDVSKVSKTTFKTD